MSRPPSHCDDRLVLSALPGLPRIRRGAALAPLLCQALERAHIEPRVGDVLVVTSKVLSRAEDRFVDLTKVVPSAAARALAIEVDKDPALVELILRESSAISRKAKGVLIVRHRLGFVSANAGIDQSNAQPMDNETVTDAAHWALLLPKDPDESARRLRLDLRRQLGCDIAIVVSDSHGRPFRLGAVGIAVGASGLPSLLDQRGEFDLDGRELRVTVSGLADQIAAAADLVAGQGAQGRAAVHLRGLRYAVDDSANARDLVRPDEQDLFA